MFETLGSIPDKLAAYVLETASSYQPKGAGDWDVVLIKDKHDNPVEIRLIGPDKPSEPYD